MRTLVVGDGGLRMSIAAPQRARRTLPAGVELYALGADGQVRRSDGHGTRTLGDTDDFLRFIDAGQYAHYLIGDSKTSPERPSNATYKLGIVAAHSAFTPHAHRGEHVVVSLGYASCGLYDEADGRVIDVRLTPSTMIRIPAMMPHSFANRGSRPLLILAANTGFGIDHEDYAITPAEAERRGVDGRALAASLRELERRQRPGLMTWRERLAARLRRTATRLEEGAS